MRKNSLKDNYEYLCGVYEKIFLWLLEDFPFVFYQISGLKHVVRKFQKVNDDVKYPTGFLWGIGLYFAMFSLADQLYQGQLNRLQARVDQIRDGVINTDGGVKKYWIEQIGPLQNAETRIQPDFWPPSKTIQSFFGVKVKNKLIIEDLKLIIRSIKFDLKNTDLRDANLSGANFQKADFYEADLRDANLSGANFQDTNLQKAKLQGVNFKDANLVGAKLNSADLSFANFENTNLKETNLQEANVYEVNFKRTIIEGTNLAKVYYLTCKQLKIANVLKNYKSPEPEWVYTKIPTILPDYLEATWTDDGKLKDCKKKEN